MNPSGGTATEFDPMASAGPRRTTWIRIVLRPNICLRRWTAKADIEDGRRGPTNDDQTELVELRRKLRVAEMENEILRRAAAYFARENVLPK
jgi:hypothetical protein